MSQPSNEQGVYDERLVTRPASRLGHEIKLLVHVSVEAGARLGWRVLGLSSISSISLLKRRYPNRIHCPAWMCFVFGTQLVIDRTWPSGSRKSVASRSRAASPVTTRGSRENTMPLDLSDR